MTLNVTVAVSKRFELLFINEYDAYYLRCVYTWMGKYLWSLISTVLQNDRLFDVRRPTGSHMHPKVVVSKKCREIDTLLHH